MISGFARRLQERRDELEWLYMELYDRRDMLDTLLERMGEAYRQREQSLRRLDAKREQDPNWVPFRKDAGHDHVYRPLCREPAGAGEEARLSH